MQTTEVKTVAPGVHRLTVVISLLAIVVGPLLYLLPARTDKLFAWTILPPLTAMFLGGAYLTALVIERLAAGEKIWANARAVYPGMLIFTTLTAAAVGSWLVGLGFALGHSALENAWERVRTAAIGNVVMGSLQLIAVARFAPGLQWAMAPAWFYVLFLLSMVGTGAAGLLQIRAHAVRA